jgi:outer membrane protein W
MSLSTLQLASTGALMFFAGSADGYPGQSMVSDESALARESACATSLQLSQKSGRCAVAAADGSTSTHLNLNLVWKSKRTASDVLTDLLNVDGIRVMAERHTWDQPDTLALRHDFASDMPIRLYCAAGVDRAVYLESHTLSPASALSIRRERSVGMMAEVGSSLQLTERLNVETDIHWMDMARDVRLMRTDAGWVGGDPITLSVSLVWRVK